MSLADPIHDGDLHWRVEKLERLVRDLTSGRDLEAASIDSGGLELLNGGELLIDGGTVRMVSLDGVEIFALINLSGTRAWKLAYDDGPTAIGTVGGLGTQHVAIWDHSDNEVVATDSASQNGLARPYLNIPMYPSRDAQHQSGGPFWPATNSTSYVELLHGFTSVWQPRVQFGMGTAASGGETEWQFLLSGQLIASGSGDVQGTYDIPGWGQEGPNGVKPGHERVFQVEVRNTTGNVSWVQVDKCYGIQS